MLTLILSLVRRMPGFAERDIKHVVAKEIHNMFEDATARIRAEIPARVISARPEVAAARMISEPFVVAGFTESFVNFNQILSKAMESSLAQILLTVKSNLIDPLESRIEQIMQTMPDFERKLNEVEQKLSDLEESGRISRPLSATQMAIVDFMLRGEGPVTIKEIMKELDLPQSSVSASLKRLKGLGIISSRASTKPDALYEYYLKRRP